MESDAKWLGCLDELPTWRDGAKHDDDYKPTDAAINAAMKVIDVLRVLGIRCCDSMGPTAGTHGIAFEWRTDGATMCIEISSDGDVEEACMFMGGKIVAITKCV